MERIIKLTYLDKPDKIITIDDSQFSTSVDSNDLVTALESNPECGDYIDYEIIPQKDVYERD